jgi:predicted DNA-binding antitoxin AbrB/MazE fold protein
MSKYAIFEHKAKKAGLHYDLRFEMPESKIWASFSFRKNPIDIKQGEKFSCVRTHDHTEREAMFTGTIEDGYGAGVLKLLEKGDCDIEAFKKVRIAIIFKGKKLKGLHHFISTSIFGRNNKYKRNNMFIFFKGRVEK